MKRYKHYVLALLASCALAGNAQAGNETETGETLAASNASASSTLAAAVENLPDWSKDLMSRIQLHGYAQGGYNYSHKGGEDTNTFEIKRVLFWANAQITDRWSFLFMHDFSSVVQEYYTDYRLTNNKALTVRLDYFLQMKS